MAFVIVLALWVWDNRWWVLASAVASTLSYYWSY